LVLKVTQVRKDFKESKVLQVHKVLLESKEQ
jgi:hypothetical protein